MTSPAAPSLDAVDLAFLRRLESQCRPLVVPPPDAPAPALLVEQSTLVRPTTLVERLLAAVPEEWRALAARVEEACANNASVIAVAGGQGGEGRSTVVACLARTLTSRGHAVEVHDRAPVEFPPASSRARHAIALVDAGIWFPGGPLRRSWLARRSLGCQAAILVRRADEPEVQGRAAALAAVGVVALGEVLTMTPPTTHSIRVA